MSQVLQRAGGEVIDNGALQGAVTARLGAMDIRLPQREPASRPDLAWVELGPAFAFRYEGEGVHRADRRWDHIRADGADCYVVQLPLSAGFLLEHCESRESLHPGRFAILSTARPFRLTEFSASTPCKPFASLHVCFSGALLRSHAPRIDAICAQPFDIVPGASRIMASLMVSALQDGPALSSAHAASFGAEMLEAVARVTESACEARGLPIAPRETSLARIRARAMAFINAHLSNPSMNIDQVAEHCRVSVRYLHAAFERSGATVAALIREQRLQQCRKVLCNPHGRHRSILNISSDWGFCDAAHFSHAYKSRFGLSPSEERLRALRDHGDQTACRPAR